MALRKTSKAFTIIEVLIVVIIAGILMAIIVPQFNKASQADGASALAAASQTLRAQVAFYRIQHNGKLPGAGAGDVFSSTQFWQDMSIQSDANGAAWTNSRANLSAGGPFGPYLQSATNNILNDTSNVIDAALLPPEGVAAKCGWAYDFSGHTGRIYGTGPDKKTLQP
jgi:prepilin-type N-terminal cleavage/methylation domain-containing protein